jgi:hypothetical protein
MLNEVKSREQSDSECIGVGQVYACIIENAETTSRELSNSGCIGVGQTDAIETVDV